MLEKKSRVFLTVAGIIIGIFTFTFFIFLSQGLTNAISGQFSSLGVNVLQVASAGNAGGPPQGGGALSDTDLARIEQVTSGTRYVAPYIFYNGLYEYGRENALMTSLSYPGEYWDEVSGDLGLEFEDGRMLRQGDSSVVVLGSKAAKDTFPDRELQVGNSIRHEGKSFRVIGIIEERGDLFVDSVMLMPFDDVKEIANQQDYSGVRVSFYEGEDIEAQREAILRKLNPNGQEERVSISSPEQAIEQFNNILGVLTMIISFISSVALLVGGINVMNTMYSAVLERINEISVMKAMGATNRDIMYLFLVESTILGLIGALIGFFMAYGVAELVSYVITTGLNFNVPVYFDAIFFIQVLFVTIFFAIVFGTYPALKAARVNPADNLRDE